MNSSIIKKKEVKKSICSRILTPKQIGPTCWFMTTFVAMFYSQRSRKLLLKASKGWEVNNSIFPNFWNNRKTLFTLLKHVLDDKYLKTKDGKDSKDYKKFSNNTFIKILSLLNKVDSKAFPYNPKTVSGGFSSEFYIGCLYKLLNIESIIYEYNVAQDFLVYSYLNEEFNNNTYRIVTYKILENNEIDKIIQGDNELEYIEENIDPPPPILIIIVRDDKNNVFTKQYKDLFPKNIIHEKETNDNLKSMNEQIFFKGVEYNLDSVILTNWNNSRHAIAGITCKKKKYIYNGWTRTSMDPAMANKIIKRKIPCELMPFDWKIKNDRKDIPTSNDDDNDDDFCLNTTKCIPELLGKNKIYYNHKLCFNFSKGDSRILIYVRKDTSANTSIDSYVSNFPPNKGQEENILNPIMAGGLQKNAIKHIAKSVKKCPDGKVLNPATGRCILIKNAKAKVTKDVVKKSPKKCPDGKVRNPATGRCILIKNAKAKVTKDVVKKSPKKCPDGKVRNPATGRCILSKNLKK
jgi:hypothetical protein